MNHMKIEKVDEAITKTKAVIAEQTAKLRDLERQRTALEDAAIVALFRKENMTDKDLAELLRLKATQPEAPPAVSGDAPTDTAAREESGVLV